MSDFHDITGQRFGRLVADEYLGGSRWRCRCDCGCDTITTYNKLKIGHTKSCGCLRNEGGKPVRDIAGQRFGRLVAIKENGRTNQGQAMWLCQCDCGNTKTIATSSLVNGLTISCGCYNSERTSKHNFKHGYARRGNKEKLYVVWCAMLKRCYDPNDHNYKYYGGRGIKVADEWRDYQTFREWAYSNGYEELDYQFDCTLDRINVDGDYSPDNCRWADWKTQMNNTRRNIVYKERIQNG